MLTKEEIKADALKFLNESSTCVVATTDGMSPRAATVYYVVDSDFNFYFITKPNTSHAKNIAANPNVALVVGTGPEHITVQVKGTASVIEGEECDRAVGCLMDMFARESVKTRPVVDVYKFKDKEEVVIKVVPSELSYLNLDSSIHKESIADNYMYLIP
jgi:uncharacterized protein YhbP (UPF0306 family)